MYRVLLIVRSIIFFIGYVIDTIFVSSLFLICYPFLPEMARHRFASMWCSTVLYWLKLACGIDYKVEGMENLDNTEGPVILISNHQSSWETIFLYKVIRPVSPILKKELLRIPFWGWAMYLQKPVALDRSKPREAGRVLLNEGAKRLRDGYSLVIFPEGTRTETGQVKRFSKGGAKLAVTSGAMVLPMTHNAGKCWPKGYIKTPGTVKVVIGKPISPLGKSAEELTREVEHWVRDNLPD